MNTSLIEPYHSPNGIVAMRRLCPCAQLRDICRVQFGGFEVIDQVFDDERYPTLQPFIGSFGAPSIEFFLLKSIDKCAGIDIGVKTRRISVFVDDLAGQIALSDEYGISGEFCSSLGPPDRQSHARHFVAL